MKIDFSLFLKKIRKTLNIKQKENNLEITCGLLTLSNSLIIKKK